MTNESSTCADDPILPNPLNPSPIWLFRQLNSNSRGAIPSIVYRPPYFHRKEKQKKPSFFDATPTGDKVKHGETNISKKGKILDGGLNAGKKNLTAGSMEF